MTGRQRRKKKNFWYLPNSPACLRTRSKSNLPVLLCSSPSSLPASEGESIVLGYLTEIELFGVSLRPPQSYGVPVERDHHSEQAGRISET